MESIEFQYTDSNYTEKGVLKNSTLDLELGKYGIASNDYQLEVSVSSWDREFDKGSLFFSNESEFGGIIEGKKVDTSKNTVTFKGKTFRGVLEKEYVQPLNGQAYFNANGEANNLINTLIKDRFGSLFCVDNIGLSDITVNYQIRDLNLLEALEKMLSKADIPSRLDINFYDGQVHLQAIPIVDLSELLQYDNSYGVTMIAETPANSYNHILALGKGELTEKLRVNLYLQNDSSWSTSENSKFKGLSRKTYLYNNTTEEDTSKLIESGIDSCEKANGTESISVNFTTDEASLFDVVGAKEEITGLSFKQPITKKILKATITSSITTAKFEYKVGD